MPVSLQASPPPGSLPGSPSHPSPGPVPGHGARALHEPWGAGWGCDPCAAPQLEPRDHGAGKTRLKAAGANSDGPGLGESRRDGDAPAQGGARRRSYLE